MSIFKLNTIILATFVTLPAFAWSQTTFHNVTNEASVGDTGYGVGAAWGDFDGDGRLDLYLVNLGQSNRLYLNNGDCTFTDISVSAGVDDYGDGVGCAWGDYDNDGYLDLFVSNRPGYHRLYRNNGDTTFSDMAPSYGMSDSSGMGESVAWGDYDGDGYIDLYKMRMQQSNILYHNLDGSGFNDVTAFAGVGHSGAGEGTSWCDYDDDRNLDIIATNAGGYNLLYRNNGDGTFTDYADSAGIREPGYSFGCAWGDYDNDGDFDLYIGRSTTNRLFRNDGDGTFNEVGSQAGVDYAGWTLGAAWGDYDNDGWLDLHLAIHQGDDVLFRNLGDGTFANVTDQAGVHNYANGRGNVWGDYNNDGFLDLYVVNHDGVANILFENQANGNHFLVVKLVGNASNRAGIGSKVVCVAGNLRMTSIVDGGSGFASQNSLPVEFGLGDNIVADSVYIHWSSGATDMLTNLQCDQFLTVIEDGIVGVAEESVAISEDFVISRVYPNPFNASTTIEFYLPEQLEVVLSAYNILGQKIATLFDGRKSAGDYSITWKAKDHPSGVYFARMEAEGYSKSIKMVLLK